MKKLTKVFLTVIVYLLVMCISTSVGCAGVLWFYNCRVNENNVLLLPHERFKREKWDLDRETERTLGTIIDVCDHEPWCDDEASSFCIDEATACRIGEAVVINLFGFDGNATGSTRLCDTDYTITETTNGKAFVYSIWPTKPSVQGGGTDVIINKKNGEIIAIAVEE